jgi:hypothetical protein
VQAGVEINIVSAPAATLANNNIIIYIYQKKHHYLCTFLISIWYIPIGFKILSLFQTLRRSSFSRHIVLTRYIDILR